MYQWVAYGEAVFEQGLRDSGLDVTVYKRKIENQLQDEPFLEELTGKIREEEAQAVFSFYFFPLVSQACEKTGVPYVSWIFGTPHYSLFHEEALKPHNFIFCFDRVQAGRLSESGAEHVYHLPLAVDTEMFRKVIAEGQKYEEDISFVGSLYTDEHYYYEQIKDMPEYVKGYLDGMCEAQLQVYGGDIITGMLPEDIINRLKSVISFQMDANYFLTFEQFMADILLKQVTVLERKKLLRGLAKEWEVTLHTNSDMSDLPGIKNGGYVSYYEQMPLVFAGSAINLNITMRSITTGIPLRALDILACGGFLISNYQEELAEFFADGEELVLFTSEEDLKEKCRFYMRHETERRRIAQRGYEKVKRDFSYKERIAFMLDELHREIG